MRNILFIILSLLTTTVYADSKDRTEYNKSMAAVMGGMAQIQSSSATMVKAITERQVQLFGLLEQAEKIKAARLDNELKRAEQFYAKRKLNQDYRLANSRTKPNLDSIIKGQSISYLPTEVILRYNEVQWLPVFNNEIYRLHMDNINVEFNSRTVSNSGIGSISYSNIHSSIEEMLKVLKNNIKGVSPAEYLLAKKFLQSLDKEAGKVYNEVGRVASY